MGLFARRTRTHQNSVLDTIIGPSATWSGTLRSDGGVRVEGRFEGCIEVAGNVVVAESGMVDGNIIARDIIIGGIVRGDVEGAGRLEVLSTGQLIGDITVASFMIDEGGLFEGISRLQGAASARMMALPAPMDSTPELPDVVIAVGKPKRSQSRPAVASSSRGARSKVTSTMVEEVPHAATVQAVIDYDANSSDSKMQAVADIIDPEPIAMRAQAGRAATDDDMDAFLEGLDLDIQPIIPESSSSNGSMNGAGSSGKETASANGTSNTVKPVAASTTRSTRGGSRSSQRRARSKNGTSA